MRTPKIEVMYVDGCPNVAATVARVRQAINAAGIDPSTEIALRRIDDNAEAVRSRFLGSPTVQVDGRDVDPSTGESDDFGLTCRVYRVDGRLEGVAPTHLIEAALTGR